MSSPWPRSRSSAGPAHGPPWSFTSIRAQHPGRRSARTVKWPPGSPEALCRTALAASSEAQIRTSSASGESPSNRRRSARTAATCSARPRPPTCSAGCSRRPPGCARWPPGWASPNRSPARMRPARMPPARTRRPRLRRLRADQAARRGGPAPDSDRCAIALLLVERWHIDRVRAGPRAQRAGRTARGAADRIATGPDRPRPARRARRVRRPARSPGARRALGPRSTPRRARRSRRRGAATGRRS
jgi:hypothetical protein